MWNRFERTVEGERTLQFEIEDVPPTMWSIAVEFMLGNYIREDVWWAAAGMSEIYLKAYYKSLSVWEFRGSREFYNYGEL